MNESQFRELMRDAIGDEPMRPWLSSAVRTRLARPQPPLARRRWAFLVAAALMMLLVAGLVGPRLLSAKPVTIVPAATPTPSTVTSPTPVDALNCRLPVQAGQEHGFIDTRSGQFALDRSASVSGLPFDLNNSGWSYSAPAKRWLPVSPSNVSPDGLSYAYLKSGSAFVELHRYDLTTGQNKTLWTHPAPLFMTLWNAAGIHVSSLPPGDIAPRGPSWIIDPVTGAAVPLPLPTSNFPFQFLPGDPQGTDGTGFHSIGVTAGTQTIWWFFNLDNPGEVDWVFYEKAPGVRVYIYRGTMGDTTSFEPGAALADSTGIWFADYNPRPQVWHWQPDGGLRKVPVSGSRSLAVYPDGPCF